MLLKNFYSKLVIFLIIFFTTLHSYYFYNISLAPFPVVGFLLLVFTFNKIDIHFFPLLIILYFVIILNALLGFYYSSGPYYFNSLIGILLGPLFFVLFFQKYKLKFPLVSWSIKAVLFVHIAAFYIQFFVFHMFSFKIDYLGFVTGEQSRTEGTGVLTDLIRSSGLFNEPASYSLYVAFFSIILLIHFKKVNVLIFLAILSCFLSLSVGGIVYAIFIILYYFLFLNRNLIKFLYYTFIVTIAITYFAFEYYELINQYFNSRFFNSEQDVSANVRFKEGFDFFFNQSFLYQFTGIGIGNYPKDISTVASGYMAIIVHFGYFFTLLYVLLNILFVRLYKFKFNYLIVFIFFLSSTMTYLNLHYWMFFAIIGIFSQHYYLPDNIKFINEK